MTKQLFETKEEERAFTQMDKYDIYVAYMQEYKERVRLNKEVNRNQTIMAEIRRAIS